MKTDKRNDDVSWSRTKKHQDKFDERNEGNKKTLNKFIEENDIMLIVASSPLFHWLEFFADPETSIDGEIFRYKGVKVIYDPYFPSTSFGFVKRDEIIKFDVPCVCGIYKDEPHP